MALFVYALTSPVRFARALGISCFFGAASPILILAGGNPAGISSAFLMLGVSFCYVYSTFYAKRRSVNPQRTPRQIETTILLFFAIISIAGALILPRIFEYEVVVFPPKSGVDSGVPEKLIPISTNYTQSILTVFLFLFFSSTRYLIVEKVIAREQIIKGILAGTIITTLLGFYQIIAYQFNLPWPTSIINSYLGGATTAHQVAFGIKRISSTFMEPAHLALHFLGVLGLFFFGFRRYLLGSVFLFVLLLSTSSTAYFGLFGLYVLWAFMSVKNQPRKVVMLTLFFAVLITFAIFLDYKFADGKIVETMILEKGETGSGRNRMYANLVAWNAFVDTWGLGVGLGSMYASGVLITTLANVGIPGSIFFIMFWTFVLLSCIRSKNNFDKAISWGIIGFFLGWVIAVPDLHYPLVWLLAALAPGSNTNKSHDDCPAIVPKSIFRAA